MDPTRIALFAALLPAVAAAAVLLVLRWTTRTSVPPDAAPAASGDAASRGVPTWLAVAAGYVAGHLALNGLPRGLPKEAWQALLPLAIVSGATLALDRFLRTRISWTRLLTFPTFVAVWVSTMPYVHEADRGVRFGVVLTAWCFSTARFPIPPARAPVVLVGLAIVSGAAAGALVIAGTLVVGQLAGVLAAALGAAFLVSLRVRLNADGAAHLACALLAALLLNGVLFAELPWWSVALLALATFCVRLPTTEGRPASGIARIVVASVLSAAAVWIAKANVPPLDY